MLIIQLIGVSCSPSTLSLLLSLRLFQFFSPSSMRLRALRKLSVAWDAALKDIRALGLWLASLPSSLPDWPPSPPDPWLLWAPASLPPGARFRFVHWLNRLPGRTWPNASTLKIKMTRMHSSRTLIVHCSGRVCGRGCLSRGCLARGVSAQRMSV